MQIVCPACHKRLQIADDKLPTDRQVRLTCPACQERFLFDPQVHGNASEDQPTVVQESAPAAASPSSPSTSTLSGTGFEITDVGTAPRALLCLDNLSHREACQSMLPALGYSTVHVPAQQAMALAYLSQVPYECFILDATFDGSSLEANPVLACLHELPMDRRRYMFVALCLPEASTGDILSAYSHGVNLILNHAEVTSCQRTLEQHIANHKRLYRVYRELRQQMGKDV